jgi:hypothetical protein
MSIFTDDRDRIENLNKSADALGGPKPKAKKKVLACKKNCKNCWGGGLLGYQPVGGQKSLIYCKCVFEKEVDVEG